MSTKLRKFLLAVLLIFVIVATLACEEETFTINVDFDAEKGSVSLPGTDYAKGESVEITVTPKDGYEVSTFTVNEVAVTLENNKYLLTVEGNVSIKVEFALIPETVTPVSVNLEYDNTQGTVSLSAPSGETYVKGENLTITVEPKAHYVTDSFCINDKSYQLTDNKYTLTLSGNVDISVTFGKEKMPESIFATLKGRAIFEGDYTYDYSDGEEFDNLIHLKTTFGIDSIHQVESDPATGEIYYDDVYGKENRKLVLITHTVENTINKIASDNLFDEYYNPFDLLKASDLSYYADNVYQITDSEKAKSAASALTGWTESIKEFLVYVENDVATKVSIVTNSIETGYEDDTYVSTYELLISEQGTATVDPSRLQPWERTTDHDALESALVAADNASFYTIRHQGHEVGYVEPEGGETRPGYGDTDYKKYISSDMIYNAYSGEENGYKVLANYVYPFDYNATANEVVLYDPVDVTSIQALQATFGVFAVEIFQYNGEGSYSLRDNNMASAVVPFIGEGANEKTYYAYATNMEIIISDGILAQIKFTYATYGITEEVTLTYDFTTEFSDESLGLNFENATKSSVLDSFIGQYRDTNGHFCNVDESGFLLDGVEIEIISYDTETATFTGLWNEQEVYVKKLSSKQLLISNDFDIFYTLTSIEDSAISIPSNLHGVWSFYDEETDTTHKFSIQTYVVRYNDELADVVSYTESEGLIVEQNGNTINLVYYGEEEGKKYLDAMVIYEDGSYVLFYPELISTDTGIEIPADYVGTYVSDDDLVKVLITYSSITVNGAIYQINSYNENSGFSGVLNEESEYLIQFVGFGGEINKDKLLVGTEDANFILNRVESLNSNYLGTWQSTGKEYTVVITDTTITINDENVAFTFGEYGYQFEMEESPYTRYLLYYVNAYGNAAIMLYDDHDLMYNLFAVQPTVVPQAMVGTWEGTENDVLYSVKIDKDGNVSIKIGDEDYSSVSAEFDGVNVFVFTYNAKTYYLTYKEDSSTLNIYEVDTIDLDLTISTTVSIPADFVGTWTSDDSSCVVVVTGNSLVVTIDGTEHVITEVTEDYGTITFAIDGTEYFIDSPSSYGGSSTMIMTSDYTWYKSLEKAEQSYY